MPRGTRLGLDGHAIAIPTWNTGLKATGDNELMKTMDEQPMDDGDNGDNGDNG